MRDEHYHYLVVSILGPWQRTIVPELTLMAKNNQCNIKKCQLSCINQEFIGSFFCEGSWSGIAKLEVKLTSFSKKYGLNIHFARTQDTPSQRGVPYRVQTLTAERCGTAHDLTQFFSQRNIPIQYCYCDELSAGDVLMNKITLGITLDPKENMASLRDNFMTFCDEKNLDAYLECDIQPS